MWQAGQLMRRRLNQIKRANLAQIYKYGKVDKFVEEIAEEVPKLNSVVQKQISTLKNTAKHHGLVSLSANQIQLSSALFVCLKQPWLTGKWKGYEPQIDHYEAIINPVLGTNPQQEDSIFKEIGYDECPSFEGYRFRTKRPVQIYVRWLSEDTGQLVQDFIKGFRARVWQHQIDHLNGKLPIDFEICKLQVQLTDEFKNPANQQILDRVIGQNRVIMEALEKDKKQKAKTTRFTGRSTK